MSELFPNIAPISYQGKNTQDELSYRYYDAQKKVLGKTMEAHLRMAVCYWHNFCWPGSDIFGEGTFHHPWIKVQNPMDQAHLKLDAAFELIHKLGLRYFTFHDRDMAPEGANWKETQHHLQTMADAAAKKMQETKIELLWGTANLFSHQRYMAGAATNPNPEVFAYAVAQVKQALDVTHHLKGHNYVLWGGREGYDTLFNTDLSQESDQLGKFLSLLVDYKHKIGFKGALLIEPKPCEPTKHQYDFDTATVFAFLQKYNLEKEFKVNIEGNHATLAGHSYPHEVAYAFANDLFGSIDANQGDAQLGWDTDQFPTHLSDVTHVMYLILKNGGFTTGGFNFDTKLRRQSVDLEDYFYAHLSGIDSLAQGLLLAADMIEKDFLQQNLDQRYQGWKAPLGQDILKGTHTFESLADYAVKHALDPKPVSGKQERLEKRWQNAISG